MDTPSDNVIPPSARFYVSSNYILPADDDERIRLNTQHGMMKAAFENRLVLAPVILKPGDRVLDSGTGAASWLLDFANEVPSTVSIYGVDISSRLFPSDPPSNIQFLAGSITQLPENWTSTFALVNQRLLFAGLSATAWQAAFSEMYRVLEPGGWVNLCELNCDVDYLDFEYGPAVKKTMILVREIFRSANVLADAVYHLAGWLEQAGFTNIHTEMRRIPLNGDEGRPMRENSCSVYVAMKTPAMKAGGFGLVQSEAEYDDLVQAYGEEVAVTDNAALLNYTISAQKPSSSSRL
ncbi:S-adenosyl-L-methionine-dependent methyltransferase [Athelia psychrophila]|uniref:S-adenosyl-L-methionine-dependent methyltransferase n=1 Tax=Athelia psychrophila TaxID=1759441 RepID=A0A166VF85_9AGAM|nr:S-adenosyl-L-methionine-dependent methyltransferase [Fibularhizoctonia sp. CBS 109695]